MQSLFGLYLICNVTASRYCSQPFFVYRVLISTCYRLVGRARRLKCDGWRGEGAISDAEDIMEHFEIGFRMLVLFATPLRAVHSCMC